MIVDDAFDAFLKGWGTVVDEETEGEFEETEIGKNLFAVGGGEFFNGFEFDEKLTFDNKVRTESFGELFAK